ncbi:MAG: cytochrome d ubiquinol oxidase subunit II, partial [Muribaculaceae bacterium]
FVQGGQAMLYCGHNYGTRQLMVNSLGRKWEFTFTTLVVFGGAFFASFPLFYSTSFGGAYWLWLLILLSFILQAVSYEFRRKSGNLYGTRTYDAFLVFNGVAGCVLLGVAVGMFFFGGQFTVTKSNILDAAAPVISQWAPTHGLEAIADWRCLLLGVAVFFLARTLAAMYFVNDIAGDEAFTARMRRRTLVNGLIFALLFVAFLVVLFTATGYCSTPAGFISEPHLYFNNLLSMWWLAIVLILAVAAVLYGIAMTAFTRSRAGIWWSGFGTAAAVIVLFCLAGYNSTAYLASTTHPASSLTIANSSSSLFTLRVMSVVSVLIPFVLAYIVCVWRKMNAAPLTPQELSEDTHQY